MDEERFNSLWTRLNGDGDPLTDEELAELEQEVRARMASVNRSDPSPDDLQTLRDARTALAEIRQVAEQREGERAERVAEAAQLLAEMGEEPAPEGGAPDGGEGGQEAPAAGEGTGDGGQPAATEGGQEGGGETAAGGPRVPSITHLAARRASHPEPASASQATADRRQTMIIASADVPGLATGSSYGIEDWAKGTARRIQAVMDVRGAEGDGDRVYFGKVSVRDLYPEERWLRQGADAANNDKVQAVLDRSEPLAAAGGICGPVAADYGLQSIGTADRPAKAGMMNFGADRGGVRFVRPHTLSSVTATAPSQVWTQATDASPGQSTKAHATFVCQPVSEKYVDAVTSIVQFGNFQARYFPEQIRQFLDTVEMVHARLAEATLLGQMITDSVAVNAANNGTGQTGAATELMAELDRAAAHARYVHRMGDADRLQFWMPEYLMDMITADIARELPGGSIDERLAVADAQIVRWFDVRAIDVVRYLDSPTGASVLQGWTSQLAGDLAPWPTKAITFLTHPGAWTFLDGGELNLGMVRDSTLNQTNDFQMFSETFEKAVLRGHFSYGITFDLCPFGGRAATVDTSALCTTGS